MLTLYYKPTCPFCQRVLGEVESMGIKLNLKDVSADPVALEELIEKGGKKQVPFLEDTEHTISMYESGDIITHLTEHHKGDSSGGDNVRESCQ